MLRPHVVHVRQVGDRARHLEHAVVGPRRPVQVPGGIVQQPASGFVGRAVAVDLARPQVAVGPSLARELARMGARHPLRDARARFAIGLRAHAIRRHGRHRQLDVDAVEQRPRNAALVVAIVKVRHSPSSNDFKDLRHVSSIEIQVISSKLSPQTLDRHWAPEGGENPIQLWTLHNWNRPKPVFALSACLASRAALPGGICEIGEALLHGGCCAVGIQLPSQVSLLRGSDS